MKFLGLAAGLDGKKSIEALETEKGKSNDKAKQRRRLKIFIKIWAKWRNYMNKTTGF